MAYTNPPATCDCPTLSGNPAFNAGFFDGLLPSPYAFPIASTKGFMTENQRGGKRANSNEPKKTKGNRGPFTSGISRRGLPT